LFLNFKRRGSPFSKKPVPPCPRVFLPGSFGGRLGYEVGPGGFFFSLFFFYLYLFSFLRFCFSSCPIRRSPLPCHASPERTFGPGRHNPAGLFFFWTQSVLFFSAPPGISPCTAEPASPLLEQKTQSPFFLRGHPFLPPAHNSKAALFFSRRKRKVFLMPPSPFQKQGPRLPFFPPDTKAYGLSRRERKVLSPFSRRRESVRTAVLTSNEQTSRPLLFFCL